MKAKRAWFTLAQAVAWIIWRDPDRSLLPPLPQRHNPQELKEWIDERLKTDRLADDAVRQLAEKIGAGEIVATGMPVSRGSPSSSGIIDAGPPEHIRIPPGRQGCVVIPRIWLDVARGGWLELKNNITNGMDTGPKYCEVTIDARQIVNHWPNTEDRLVEYMEAEAKRVLLGTGHKAKRDNIISDCVKKFSCTHDEAEIAFRHVSPDLRRSRGGRNRASVPK